MDLTIEVKPFVPALTIDDGLHLRKRFAEGKVLRFDRNPPRFNAAHIQNVVDELQQMLGGIPDFLKIFLCIFAYIRILQCDTVKPDDCVHGRPDFMTHVRQKRRLGLTSMLSQSQCFAQGFSVFCELDPLQMLALDRVLEPAAVFFLFIFDDKAVQHACPQHISHGVKGHQGIKDLYRDKHHHRDSEQSDGQVAESHGAFRSVGDAQGVYRCKQKHQDLYAEYQKTKRPRMISSVLIEPEQDRKEQIYNDHYESKSKEYPSGVIEDFFKSVPAVEI